jgi:hypothetical protein
MSEKTNSDTSEAASTWMRTKLDAAVEEIMGLDVINDELIEARPVWSVPFRVIVGQLREAHEQTTFRWLICGDMPTDQISSTVAATPREALRYFSLKWQMDAGRYDDPATRKAHGLDESHDWSQLSKKLVAKAEELYEMAEDESIWR